MNGGVAIEEVVPKVTKYRPNVLVSPDARPSFDSSSNTTLVLCINVDT